MHLKNVPTVSLCPCTELVGKSVWQCCLEHDPTKQNWGWSGSRFGTIESRGHRHTYTLWKLCKLLIVPTCFRGWGGNAINFFKQCVDISLGPQIFHDSCQVYKLSGLLPYMWYETKKMNVVATLRPSRKLVSIYQHMPNWMGKFNQHKLCEVCRIFFFAEANYAKEFDNQAGRLILYLI